jgi:HNH endonuclease
MIPITRATLPDELSVQLVTLSKELAVVPAGERTKAARALWEKSGTRTRVYRPLKHILQQMALGLEQCMYCGADFGTDVDHFDPIARTPLRAFDWPNHLLACPTCNSNHKRDRFPTDAGGRPLLIDPTAEDPFEHMTRSLSTDVYHPLSDKGIATITSARRCYDKPSPREPSSFSRTRRSPVWSRTCLGTCGRLKFAQRCSADDGRNGLGVPCQVIARESRALVAATKSSERACLSSRS